MLLRSLIFLSTLAGSWAISATHQKFIDLAARNNGLVKLDGDTYELITASDREWSVAIQLTAMGSNMKCKPCTEFNPSFNAVAKSWQKAPAQSRQYHFFATLDFSDGTEVFRRLGLNTAPVLHIHPAARGPHKPQSGKTDVTVYDFTTYGFEPATLAENLSRYTPLRIPYTPPRDYSKIISGLSMASIVLMIMRFAQPLFTNRWAWACLVLGSSLTFTSGYMFSQIRGVPYMVSQKGQVSWVAGGYQNQYGIEVHLVGALYGLLAFAYGALIFLIPRINSPARQRLGAYIWSFIIFILFSVMLSFFRMKNPSYPFRLLFV